MSSHRKEAAVQRAAAIVETARRDPEASTTSLAQRFGLSSHRVWQILRDAGVRPGSALDGLSAIGFARRRRKRTHSPERAAADAEARVRRDQQHAERLKAVTKALRDGLTRRQVRERTGASERFVSCVARELGIQPPKFLGAIP